MSLRHPALLQFRAFSTTHPTPAHSASSALAHQHAKIPPYPYGPSLWYKQSNFGLYGGTRIQFGNTVSERTEIKNRRKWHPNIRHQRLWSDALGRFVRVKVLARVLRTIDKVGGLDEYLLGGKAARIKELGMGGWALRWRVTRTEKVRERFRQERRALGLPDDGWVKREKILGSYGSVMHGEEVKGVEEAFDRALDEGDGKGEEGGVELGFMDEKPVKRAGKHKEVYWKA